MLQLVTNHIQLNNTSNSVPEPQKELKVLTMGNGQPKVEREPPQQILVIGKEPPQQTLTIGYPTAEAYKQYDHRTHVYMKPDTYIGADEKVVRDEWLYDIQNGRMINSTIDFVPGCERLCLEILTNASDNVGRSRRAGVDPGRIDIMMDNSSISITNYGLPIPIEIHPDEKVYVPQMIFGSLLTSSNYEVERHEAGTNGIGAKAANIFSTEFMVIIHDHIRHLKYTQIWNNNMTIRGDPIIEQYTGKNSSVQVVYKMDFARFGYPVPVTSPNGEKTGGYPPEAFALFARHAIDISFTAKTVVTFNGHEFNYVNIRDYARLYFGDSVDTAIVHYQWPAGTEVINKKKGYQVARNPAITAEIELIAIDTPDAGNHVSFVNCMMTRDGGVHVNAAVKAVGDSAVQMINENMLKKLTRQNKGKELDAKEKRAHTITINDVKPHISILLSVKVINPKFTSQTKTMLHSPVPRITISEDELRSITRWQLIDRLYAALEAKQFSSMAKTDGKLKRYVRLLKGIDANNAGKAQRHQCVLYITEGRSGAGYANKLVALVPGGRDNIGVLPMKGKLFNVMGKDIFQIEKNKEIKELKKMLGLCEGLDYLDSNNFNKLRYGAIMIMADSDVDGKHIIGLILNFFYCRFPSLLARGFVMYYRTPTLRVTFNRNTLKFYTQREYDEWKAATPNYKNWKHKYYKGLGTSKDSEIKDDFRTPRIVTCFYDADAPAAMKLAFDRKLTNQRKDWIGQWHPVLGVDDIQMQPISWFINHEMILFSIADVQRSIPKLTDGLKESYRKILHGAHKHWKIDTKKTDYSEFKVAQFAAHVAKVSNYHHGEVILDDVIVGMAQDFTGANNIPWFTRDGQYGCVDPNTPILVWNGSIKLAKDITIDDILVGDDGEPRHISKIVNGIDYMYDIIQNYGETYRVNSKHILTLHFPKHKHISWKGSSNKWHMEYYDTKLNTIKSKEFSVTATRNKEQSHKLILDFASTIPDNNIFDIDLQTYLSFPQSRRDLFTSVRNLKSINWPKRDVPIDPYIFGMWLGDGRSNGYGFTSADSELIKEWVIWLDKINVEVVHHKSGEKGYHYGFRKKGYRYGNSLPIGHKEHSSKTCGACLNSINVNPACDWIYNGREVSNKIIINNHNDTNSFIDILKEYNLHNNKHIPEIFIINDEETRLQLLAGLIDTDGTLNHKDVEGSQSFEICQEIHTHGHIIDAAEYIARSLGFKTMVSISHRPDSTIKRLRINGDIRKIPTRLERKQATKDETFIGSGIKVQFTGIGSYVGWYLDGNERFLFGDFTCGHNTRFQGGKDASETRYSYTRPERIVAYILRKEDHPILKHVIDEGAEVEPETYYPIIPMILVNGAHGIGTGYSTYIPNHNPLDIIQWLRLKLQGTDDKDLPLVLPWYRDFQGIIKVIDRRYRRKRGKVNLTIINNINENGIVVPQIHNMEAEDEPHVKEDLTLKDGIVNEDGIVEDEDDIVDVAGSRPLLSMITMGKFHIDLNGTIVITELPIGRWPHSYHKWLEGLVEEKKITGFRDLSVDNRVYFEIYGFGETPNHRNLKLQRTMGMSNMVLLDENNRPTRYDTAFDILEAFYSRRLPIYQQRKDYILGHLTQEIITLNHKIRFIRAVINKEIRIINRKISDIRAAMDILGIPHEIYESSKTRNLSEDDILSFTNQIAAKENERSIIEQITPEQMWLRELDELEEIYLNIYGLKKQAITLALSPQSKIPFPKFNSDFKLVSRKLKQTCKPAQGIMLNITNPIESSPKIMLNITESPSQPVQGITLSITDSIESSPPQ